MLFAETGALLGATLGLVMPGAFFLGLLGGVALAATRLGKIGRGRRRELEARVEAADTSAASLLVLHDRVDELGGPPARPTRRATAALGIAAMSGLALGLLGLGVSAGSFPITALGVAISFWPAATLVDMTVRREERAFARKLLDRAQDPELPGAPG